MNKPPLGPLPPLPQGVSPFKSSETNVNDDEIEDNIDEVEEDVHVEDLEEALNLDASFKADLEALEERWFKNASRLTSYLVSPIHDAAAKGNVEGLEHLIKNNNESVDSRDNVDNTPLHWAAGSGRAEAITWLLDNGANINAVNLLGDTALHKAVWRRHFNAVQILCARGIDRSIVNKQGHRAIDLARDVDIGTEILRYEPETSSDDDEDLKELYDYEDDGEDDSEDDEIKTIQD